MLGTFEAKEAGEEVILPDCTTNHSLLEEEEEKEEEVTQNGKCDATQTRQINQQQKQEGQAIPLNKIDDHPNQMHDDLIRKARDKKAEGNAFYANQQYSRAAEAYHAALQFLDDITADDGDNNDGADNDYGDTAVQEDGRTDKKKNGSDSSAPITELQVSVRSNLAQAFLKLHQFEQAELECSRVISRYDETCTKAWYRRALAREQLAFCRDEPGEIKNRNSKSNNNDKKVIMAQSLEDLKICVRLLQSSKDTGSQMKASLAAMTRVHSRLKRWQEDNANNEPADLVMQDAAAATSSSRDGAGQSTTNGSSSPSRLETVTSPLRPSPQDQRQIVMRLLIARNVGLQQKATAHTQNKNGNFLNDEEEGEALFLLDWNWWCKWCRHVDFFHTNTTSATFTGKKHQPSAKIVYPTNPKAEHVLQTLPSGGILPYYHVRKKKRKCDSNKKRDHDNDDDSISDGSCSSTDSEQEDHRRAPPGPMDNSALLLLPALDNNKNTKKGATTKTRFYQQWYKHCQHEQTSSANILSSGVKGEGDGDETDITMTRTDFPDVRPHLVRGFHYELIPREVYSALRSWYRETTPSICRRTKPMANTNSNGKIQPHCQEGGATAVYIQLYPYLANLPGFPVRGEIPCDACKTKGATKRCSRCQTVSYCDRFCQESHWPYHKGACGKILASRANGKTVTRVEDVGIYYSNGYCGLNNMGNTCFMASPLQCLSHATPLTRYFLSNQFKLDINAANPLGSGGKLALAFEAVIKELWLKPNIRTTSPTALKRAIALFAPRFAGCLQHDAHEFLSYLLDALHEDLNRIRKAPYVEMPDAGDHGPNLGVAGAEAWECHLKRNDSLVMDTFYGQFKSTCICPNPGCGRVSVSFDAFNHVSLEIPQLQISEKWFGIFLFTVPRKGEPCILRHAVSVRRGSLVADLKQALYEVTGIPSSHMILCEVSDHNINELLSDKKPVSAIRPDEVLCAYQVDPYTTSSMHTICLHALLRHTEEGDEAAKDPAVDPNIRALFGFPFMTSCDSHLTCRQLWDHIWQRVRTMVIPLDDQGSEENVDPNIEMLYQQLLNIRVTDGDGNSIPIFPVDNNDKLSENIEEGEESNEFLRSPYLPRNLDEKTSKFLGEDCTNKFLFFSLDWVESVAASDDLLKHSDAKCSNSSSNQLGGSNKNKKDEQSPQLQNGGPLIPNRVAIDIVRFGTFVDHPSFNAGVAKQREQEAKSGTVSLDECFETFTKAERLDEHNKWYCSNCKNHVRALKRMELWRLPNILIVNLKRFELHGYRREKLTTLVDFPLENLDMRKYCGNPDAAVTYENGRPAQSILKVVDGIPAVYDLFGVVNHFGRMGFGHYTAFCRDWSEYEISNEWALYDDSSVRNVGDGRGSHDGIVTPAAYILFYRRRNFN